MMGGANRSVGEGQRRRRAFGSLLIFTEACRCYQKLAANDRFSAAARLSIMEPGVGLGWWGVGRPALSFIFCGLSLESCVRAFFICALDWPSANICPSLDATGRSDGGGH
jgi:hypothetical protein